MGLKEMVVGICYRSVKYLPPMMGICHRSGKYLQHMLRRHLLKCESSGDGAEGDGGGNML